MAGSRHPEEWQPQPRRRLLAVAIAILVSVRSFLLFERPPTFSYTFIICSGVPDAPSRWGFHPVKNFSEWIHRWNRSEEAIRYRLPMSGLILVS